MFRLKWVRIVILMVCALEAAEARLAVSDVNGVRTVTSDALPAWLKLLFSRSRFSVVNWPLPLATMSL